jgi:tRNA-Thr(GGU) m(6)t(6)A37 methyltransferase TsaA
VSLLAETYTVRPIGFVRSAIDKPADDCWAGLISVIELDPQQFTADSTIGLADFSHVEIVFVFSRVAPEKVFTGARHPRDRTDWPKTGIFAQRAKDRPNRIGVTTCKIESVDGLHISVRELDAIDGTPVLDIKPYVQEFGPREPVRQAAWSRELMASYFKPPK